jgi:hypothetical protein
VQVFPVFCVTPESFQNSRRGKPLVEQAHGAPTAGIEEDDEEEEEESGSGQGQGAQTTGAPFRAAIDPPLSQKDVIVKR